MAIGNPYDTDVFLYSAQQALEKRVFEILKSPLMEIAEREIDKAVEQAVKSMQIDLAAYKDPAYMRNTLEIILRKGTDGRT